MPEWIPTWLIHTAMLWLGLTAHYCKEFVRIQKEKGVAPCPIRYWTKHPYQTVLCFVGAFVGYLGLHEAGQLTAVTAFGCGWMANSMADVMGKRAGQAL